MNGKLTFRFAGEECTAVLNGSHWTVTCPVPDPDVQESLIDLGQLLNQRASPIRFSSPSHGFPERAALSEAKRLLGGVLSDLPPLPVVPNRVY